MNATLSVQELWSQIRMLPAGERHWLANKLYDYGWQTSYMIMRKCMRRRKNASRLTPWKNFMPVLSGRVPISRLAASVPRKKSDV